MYNIVYTTRMKHDAKLMKKRGKDMSKLVTVLALLAEGQPLPEKYKDHQLTGGLKDFRECHIEPDWLLMYQIFEGELILSATATGWRCFWPKRSPFPWERRFIMIQKSQLFFSGIITGERVLPQEISR